MARVTLIEVGSETGGQTTEYQCRVGANGLLADGIDDGADAATADVGRCDKPCAYCTRYCHLTLNHYGSHMCSERHSW
jgi:hypothetical protein